MSKKYLKTAFIDEISKVSRQGKSYSKKQSYRAWRIDQAGDWSDSLIRGWNPSSESPQLTTAKRTALIVLVILAIFGLFMRIFHLQIIQGYQNRELADSNRIQVKLIHAPRGVIYDRNGKILAQNEPGFRIIDAASSASSKTRYISRDAAIKMEIENDPNLRNLEVDSLRSYPNNEKTAHILGYVSEITAEELNDPRFKTYRAGDKIGRGGVEESYEKVLRGIDGGEVIEVDSVGKKVRTLRQTPPTPGSNIVLTIDVDLQAAAYDALQDEIAKLQTGFKAPHPCCGAIVAENPNNGQILSLVSFPSFNPNDINEALVSENSPLLNRAIAGTYPPGSTFKIVSSLAALASKKINALTEYEDTGIIHMGPYSFANWYFTEYGRTEGAVNMLKAIQRSNDIYFYQLGAAIGEQALADMAYELNLGQPLGIDLPEEASGLIADKAWKQKNLSEGWFLGDTLHTAIGQGFTLVTPLQINNLISAVAMDGKEFLPHLIQRITSPEGVSIKEFNYDPYPVKDIRPEDMSVVKKGLELVPKQGGTAWPFFNFTIPTAGKTGTAEFGDPEGRTHAWYTSYAPAVDPQIALTVLVEAGGEGSTVAGFISKEIYRWYFSQDKLNLKDLDQAPLATQSAKTLGE
ncbi:hypothetical protein A2631_05670 [Candidatus Daviesbacteria bacterium RIFCSPHIGHO2_01_FULL_44_29]|uniref:Beta-lactamase n=1 Tax=Candidatus Daviesbacteria bacterium RIFCSPHIGHO2_02_FULL_43_12 TaxID=1797776 RepID=A0A1F5KIJ4_9BACT|nr:MAG: hypothetical protein A2631_05670 [Candidatus Daviesbacteria bacterium RIFCSPHIGHO2_01_FULL_44_29]OGE40659.1 MAG: hypothetical protein A3D25_05885 [Candidatus Daviesbacteria bacterium RIFCSPHIGHO2_02_FULL_43_12]OGE69845.1 MAG: hypothetical protein A3B55_05545 [Candidatus Daviesbacteria bacterium RIFCSPLOWO2_01_FULL_43_15]